MRLKYKSGPNIKPLTSFAVSDLHSGHAMVGEIVIKNNKEKIFFMLVNLNTIYSVTQALQIYANIIDNCFIQFSISLLNSPNHYFLLSLEDTKLSATTELVSCSYFSIPEYFL